MASVRFRQLCVLGSKQLLSRVSSGDTAGFAVSRNLRQFLQQRCIQTTSAKMTDKTLFGESGDEINLVMGAPGIRHLKLASDIIQKATLNLFEASLVREEAYVLQYGPRLGSTHARSSIAKFLADGYGDQVNGDSIVVTGGATNGLQMACTHFFKSGDVVFVEDPTYFIAVHILKKDLDLKVVPVPTNDEGIDIDAYEKLLEQYCSSGEVTDAHPFRAMCYLIPTYHNPRGHILSPDHCKRLVQLARKYEILNFCDDVYNLLHFDVNTRAPARFLSYDNPSDSDFKGHTISNGTFSKILGPGMRVGWWETSPRLIDHVTKSNILWGAGCTNHYGSEVIASAIDLGLQQSHLRDMNTEYQAKVKSVYNYIKENFPEGVKFKHLQGGYFFWIELPSGWVGADVAKIALEKYKVRVLPGANCSAVGSFPNCIRVSIAYLDEVDILEGVNRLAQALKDYSPK